MARRQILRSAGDPVGIVEQSGQGLREFIAAPALDGEGFPAPEGGQSGRVNRSAAGDDDGELRRTGRSVGIGELFAADPDLGDEFENRPVFRVGIEGFHGGGNDFFEEGGCFEEHSAGFVVVAGALFAVPVVAVQRGETGDRTEENADDPRQLPRIAFQTDRGQKNVVTAPRGPVVGFFRVEPVVQRPGHGIEDVPDGPGESLLAETVRKTGPDLVEQLPEDVDRQSDLRPRFRSEEIRLAVRPGQRSVPDRMRRHAPRALLQNRRQIIQDRHQPPLAVPGKTERQHQSSHPVPPSEIPVLIAAAVSVDGEFTISGKKQTLRRQSPDLLRLRHQIRDKGGSVFLPFDFLPCLPVRKRREELMDKGSRFNGFVKVLRKKGLHIKILLIHRNAPFRPTLPK